MEKDKNKKGWIKIVEVFMAIALLLGFLMVIIWAMDRSEKNMFLTEENNIKILKGIEIEPSLRNSVLSLEIPSYSDGENFPTELEEYLSNNTLLGQECLLYVCEATGECNMEVDLNKEIYSSEILIFSNLTSYFPRKLKVFCYNA